MKKVESKLTPSKIMRLLQMAEATTTPQLGPAQARIPRRVLAERNDADLPAEPERTAVSSGDSKYNTRCESSGLLDLEQCEAFGESCIGEIDNYSVGMSFGDSKSFNPGEMTGRSTGASECDSAARACESAAIDALAARLQQQSCDVAEIVRQSICDYTFQTNRDLSRDEESFMRDRGALPVAPAQLDLNITRATDKKTEQSYRADTTSDMSVGSYFMKGSADLAQMIGRSNSPQYDVSMAPSLPEGDSRTYGVQPGFTTINDSDCVILDTTLDCVPTRQPRAVPFVSAAHTILSNRSAHPPPTQHAKSVNNAQTNHNAQNNLSVYNTSLVYNATSIQNVSSSVYNGPSTQIAPSIFNAPAVAARCAPSLQHLAPPSMRHEDSTLGLDGTLSISLIEKCLGKSDTDFTPSMLFAEAKQKQKRAAQKPAPPRPTLPEPSRGQKDTFTIAKNDRSRLVPTQLENPDFVATLKHTGKSDTASSAGSVNTVINVPAANSTDRSKASSRGADKENVCKETPVTPQTDTSSSERRSASKSARSVCTVQENSVSTSNVEDSPPQPSVGGVLWSGVSPNMDYRELEQSIDWHELLLLQDGVGRGSSHWVDVTIDPVEGLVGIRATVAVRLTSVSDAWLSVTVRLDATDERVAVDAPRFPLLLPPRASDALTLTLTALRPLDDPLPLTVFLKDTCEDADYEQRVGLQVKFRLPEIEIVTADGDELTFPPTQIDSDTVKTFFVVNDCGESLNLALSVSENAKVFSIGSSEVVKREDVQRRLAMDHRLVTEDGMVPGCNYRAMKANSKTVCALPRDMALRVMMICHAPSSLEPNVPKVTLVGSVKVQLVGTGTWLRSLPLSAEVGTVKLLVQMIGDKLHMTKDTHSLELRNAGSVAGAWRASVRGACAGHLAASPALLRLAAGGGGALRLEHARDVACCGEGVLVLESVHEGSELLVELSLRPEPVSFPIKTTHSELAWVREGRRELSLKNASARAVTVRCKMHGDGFALEGGGGGGGGGAETLLKFAAGECRALSVVYRPREAGLHKAKLTLCLENGQGSVKSVRLHGWSARGGGGGGVRWASAALTCGEMAIVFARRRSRVSLTLENRSREPAFYSAKMLFNMQYRSLAGASRVTPARGVIAPHATAHLAVELDWARLERLLSDAAATTLASLFVLVGAEVTRRRVLRILNNEPDSEVTASPAEDLSRLKGPFQGEDPRLDLEIRDFDETKKSLAVLTGSIQELTAQIELTRDNGAESTMVIADETSIEHHTLLD